jgi:hypothetical protein
LLAKVYQRLIRTGKPGECVSISIPDIYIKLPKVKQNKNVKLVKKQVYTLIAAVLANPDEKAAHFKGSYLLISNRYDDPE